jgi:DNA-binding NarL/FixJ family response regulator
MIRVLVADDHGVVRAGLVELLSQAQDIEVVGAASGGRQAVELAIDRRPDVVLMDLSMPGVDGIEATRELQQRATPAHVVVLTSFSDRRRIVAAIDAGAIGYLLKDAEPDELLRGVRAAARGESPLDPKAARQLVAARREPPGPEEQLTEREREILELVAKGQPNKVIALRLQIAEKTVKNHLSHIFQILGVSDRTQAALWVHQPLHGAPDQT